VVRGSIGIRGVLPLVGSVLVALGGATTAQASYTIGQTSFATDGCGGNQVLLQAATAGAPSYAASSDGVIVSWSYLAHASTPNITLKVYHAVQGDATTWFTRSASAQRTGGTSPGQIQANKLNTFTESPGIPIKTGDVLGLTGSGGANIACVGTASNSDRMRVKNPPDPPVGQNSGGFLGDLPMLKVGMSAVVEPDADADGFGDESQDSCPTDPAVHTGACPADVSVVKIASANPRVGSDLTYGLFVTNNSATNAAPTVAVTDTLPAGVSFVSASAGQGFCLGTTTISCALGTLTPGQTTTVTIVVRPTAAGPLSNTADVSSAALDNNGANNSSTVGTTVAPAPLPVLSALKLQPPSFLAAKSGATVVAAAKPGTVVSYQNTQPATVTFTVQKPARGIKQGKTCVKPPKNPPSTAKRCTRYVSKGSFTRLNFGGPDRFRFTGRLGGKTLAPGNYRLRVVARNLTGPSKAKTAGFTVKKP
jgi:uncharacterized repeat protein (TIGR01451 family)